MTITSLFNGPQLVKHARGQDVTSHSHEFLFDHVELGKEVVPHDILKLLDAAPALKPLLRRSYTQDVLNDSCKGPIKAQWSRAATRTSSTSS